MKTCFIVTTEMGWRNANKVEDVQRHGPDIDLEVEDLTSSEENDLLELFSIDSDDEEDACENDDSCYSEVVSPATIEFLARNERNEDEARLARRLEEQLAGNVVLGLVGISPKARDRMAHALEDRLNGVPETLASQRAKLRHDAVRLAPQNLTVMIGAPEEKRHA